MVMCELRQLFVMFVIVRMLFSSYSIELCGMNSIRVLVFVVRLMIFVLVFVCRKLQLSSVISVIMRNVFVLGLIILLQKLIFRLVVFVMMWCLCLWKCSCVVVFICGWNVVNRVMVSSVIMMMGLNVVVGSMVVMVVFLKDLIRVMIVIGSVVWRLGFVCWQQVMLLVVVLKIEVSLFVVSVCIGVMFGMSSSVGSCSSFFFFMIVLIQFVQKVVIMMSSRIFQVSCFSLSMVLIFILL